MANYIDWMAALDELAKNPAPRVPVLLCLDTSGSMNDYGGRPIRELNEGIGQYLEEMRRDNLTRYSVETAIVTFNNEAECVSPFTCVDQMRVKQMTASGWTFMEKGLELGLKLLEQRKKAYAMAGTAYYQPILVVMTDGKPNGDKGKLDAMIAKIRGMVNNRHLTVIAVGLGPDADMTCLHKFTGVAHRLHNTQFREFFAWLSSSVSTVSASVSSCGYTLNMDDLAALEAQPWPSDPL